MATFWQLTAKAAENRTWAFRYRPSPNTREIEVRKDDKGNRFGTKRDAQLYYAFIATAVASGTFIDPKLGRETFEAFFIRWSYSQIWETNTRRGYGFALKCVTFRNDPLREINQNHIQQWVASMAHSGLASSTIKERMRKINKVFVAAGPNGYKLIPSNPMANVKAPRKDQAATIHAVRRDEIPEPELVGQWVNAATGQAKTMFAICAFAGLRSSEACGVQLGDVDFLRRTLTVNRQVVPAGKDRDGNVVESAPGSGIQIKPPKYGSVRTIDVPSELLDVINTHLANYGTIGAERWLFRSRTRPDIPPTYWAILYNLRVVRRAVPAVQAFSTHGLRHFYASALIADGCEIPEVQEAMGHANASTTLDTYTHLFRKRSESRTRSAMSGVMAAAFADRPTDDRGARRAGRGHS